MEEVHHVVGATCLRLPHEQQATNQPGSAFLPSSNMMRAAITDCHNPIAALHQEVATIHLDGGDAGSWTFECSGRGRAPVGVVRRYDVAAPVSKWARSWARSAPEIPASCLPCT